jgi:hypothetical protein
VHFKTPIDIVSYAVKAGLVTIEPIEPAEQAVLDCLRTLQAIPDAGSPYAASLMDQLALIYLNSSADETTTRRRAYALLRIAGAQ